MNRPIVNKHRQPDNNRLIYAAFEWMSAMVAAMVMLVIVFTFLFRNVVVDGDSMLPTLKNGDRLLLSSAGGEYHRGDIIVVNRYTEEPLIKRVIAVAGDTVEILENNVLLVNGQVQYEPYIQGINEPRDMVGPITVPEDYLFVLGDNRSISKDSRFEEIGCVYVKDVVGRAVSRLWPLSSFGGVYGNMETNY